MGYIKLNTEKVEVLFYSINFDEEYPEIIEFYAKKDKYEFYEDYPYSIYSLSKDKIFRCFASQELTEEGLKEVQ